MTKVKAACIQLRSSCTLSENIAQSSHWIIKAASQGANVIVTPEMTPLLVRDRNELLTKVSRFEEDPALLAFCELAARLEVWLIIGSLPTQNDTGEIVNRQVVLGPDGYVYAYYDKIHMFDVELGNGEAYHESNSYQAGNRAVLAKTPFGRIGMSICYDVRFPHLYRLLAQAGADILTVPAAFTKVTGQAHWETLLRARAIETGSFVLAAAQGGQHQDGRETYGNSMIIGPWGDVLAHASHDEPGIITAEFDLGDVSTARGKIPSLRNGQDYRLCLVGDGISKTPVFQPSQ